MTLVEIYAAFIAPMILVAGAYAMMRWNRHSIQKAKRERESHMTGDLFDPPRTHTA